MRADTRQHSQHTQGRGHARDKEQDQQGPKQQRGKKVSCSFLYLLYTVHCTVYSVQYCMYNMYSIEASNLFGNFFYIYFNHLS